jgi:hypothetical protein
MFGAFIGGFIRIPIENELYAPNQSLQRTAGGGGVFEVLWFTKVFFCLQSLVLIHPAAAELYR